MKKILVVFGTRPEAIKMAPLVIELRENSAYFETKVCVTAQHREMLDQVLRVFDIKPDFDLNIMKPGQDLYDVTSNVLLGIKNIISTYRPDFILVHGDTTTAMTSALAAYYQKIPVGHVEAGLRTGNVYSPFPEEMNRKLIGNIALYNYAPTVQSFSNLEKENVLKTSIIITGNTIIDALKIVSNKISENKMLHVKLREDIAMSGYSVTSRPFILVTGHRRENFGQGFVQICEALKSIANLYPNFDIVYPVHLNPNVRSPVMEILSDTQNIFLIDPLEYLQFVFLMMNCYLVLTDSGGIQEEAPSLGKPVLVMRETTERPEAIAAGTARLVGANKENILRNVKELIDSEEAYTEMANAVNPYGDGKACGRIVEHLRSVLA